MPQPPHLSGHQGALVTQSLVVCPNGVAWPSSDVVVCVWPGLSAASSVAHASSADVDLHALGERADRGQRALVKTSPARP